MTERSDSGGPDRESETDSSPDRWLSGPAVLETPLPADVQTALGRLLGEGSVETLGEWVAAVRRRTGGGSIAIDDLCHADGETAHWGDLEGERFHFRCFYDAVVLSALTEDPVAIRTEGPDGTAIEARADGTAAPTVVPETAVVSFGVDETVEPETAPSYAAVYAAVCPFVRAFPDREAYERWADTVPAATVAMPFDASTAIAAGLIE